ncbi:MAG: type II toxin-antitoxin system RelE/ParE family toxin [Euryarchaeota archaeon]|nr:type II toxin-antitoxin system RelE/ParE family toxin [Euryarchaeota archaeon]
MAKIIWSPRAAGDLEEICNFIARDSDHYARQFALRVVEIVESLPAFPKSGRMVPEYQKESLREKIFQNYRIVYRLKNSTIEVVALTHGARVLEGVEK